MKLLADEILSILTAEPVSAKALAKTLAADPANVRAAIQELDASGRAKWIVRGKGGAFYVASPDCTMRVCIICHREFVPKPRARGAKSIARTCSRSCVTKLTWLKCDKEKRVSKIAAKSRRPEHVARMRKQCERMNKRDSAKSERRAELNLQMWADPYKKARLGVAISKALSRKDSRQKLSQNLSDRWKDPEARKKLVEGMKGRSRSSAYCAAQVVRSKGYQIRRRAKYLQTEEAKALQKLRSDGLNITDCAKIFGKPRHWASSRLKAIDLAIAERETEQLQEAA